MGKHIPPKCWYPITSFMVSQPRWPLHECTG